MPLPIRRFPVAWGDSRREGPGHGRCPVYSPGDGVSIVARRDSHGAAIIGHGVLQLLVGRPRRSGNIHGEYLVDTTATININHVGISVGIEIKKLLQIPE